MNSYLLDPDLPSPGENITWSGLYGSAIGMGLAEAARKLDSVLVIVLEDQRQLQLIEHEIKFYLPPHPSIPIMHFPTWECLPYDVFSPHEDIISERLRLLSLLPGLERGIVLTHTDNLVQRLPPRDYVWGHSFSLVQNQEVDLDKLRSRLVDSNYISVNQVVAPGEFAVRGGLIDVFPMGTDRPFRLDLFDNELESIRIFDPETQRSLETVPQIEILPAREFPMNEAGVKQFRSSFRRQFEGDPRTQHIYEEVSRGNTPPGTEFFFPLFFENTANFFDYLPQNVTLASTGELENYLATYSAEIKDRFRNSNYDVQRRVLPPDVLYLTRQQVLDHFQKYTRIQILSQPSSPADWTAASNRNRQFPVDARKERPYGELINHIQQTRGRILIVVDTPGRREAMNGILSNNQLHPEVVDSYSNFVESPDSRIGIATAPLDRGFHSAVHNIEIICESQLYGEKVHQRRRRSRETRDPDSIIKSLAELHIGDPVVHIEHGVGRYQGLNQIAILGEETEYLTLEYENSDRLYIPVLSLNLISRFVGGSPDLAPLHRLGGDQWERSKKRAREKAHDVATELLEIEALRSAREGTAFNTDELEYEKFISQFPFEETPDQLQSINEVLRDLRSPSPMDRLVCGDVGFGKTEVALRASFVVTHNYRQVAILAPTTLLAHQHYQSFQDRFSDWPVNIAVLSRFNTKRQSNEIVEQIAQGKVDIVIGTHRLLQEDIRFSKLGLLIIDEEHRFGVRQKEKLKRLRSQVDILTLTATPIPRTLNITMAGLREISIIATPPVNRISIKTFVRESNRSLVREACLREIRRGGQVFYLHNDVRTIERTAAELAELLPEAEINIAHGQMRESQLERVMQDFYHQRFNILVCSTIIESGIDIPSANTIIIDRADRFGLAQLHQLRGRVGRSHHQAFAYLLIPGKNIITGDAKKRLDAIDSMEDLGAGFALASHDLEIRGAGELLGETQSGLIDEVGFSLYSEYLTLAVESIRQGKLPVLETSHLHGRNTIVDLHVPALFPDDYLSNAHTRLVLYKRIASAASLDELEELQIETIDRFGLLPSQGKNLFRLTAIRMQAERLDISKLDVGENGGLIEFYDNPVIDVSAIFQLIDENPLLYRLAGPNSVRFLPELEDVDQRINHVNVFLSSLEGTLQ